MRRRLELLKKRKIFITNYFKENQDKLHYEIIDELVEQLFISEKTIYNIISLDSDEFGRRKPKKKIK